MFQDNVIFAKLLASDDTKLRFNSVEKEALQKWWTIEDDSIIQDFLVEEELENLNDTLLTVPQEIYSDDEVDEVPVAKKLKVSRQSIIDGFEDLIASCAERNLPKTIELLKRSIKAFKTEDTMNADTKFSKSIQMTVLDCFRPQN